MSKAKKSKKTSIDLDKPHFETEYHVMANQATLKSVAVFLNRDEALKWAKEHGYTRMIKTVREVQ